MTIAKILFVLFDILIEFEVERDYDKRPTDPLYIHFKAASSSLIFLENQIFIIAFNFFIFKL